MTIPNIHESIGQIQSIAVIGAGAAGASVIKALMSENKFLQIQGFEKRSTFGGLWNHSTITDSSIIPIPSESPSIDLQPVKTPADEYIYPTAVYDDLDTNVPKDIMSYGGLEFREELPIFPDRRDVLEYINEYSEEILPYVRFNTKVVSVEQVEEYKWKVVSRPINDSTQGGKLDQEDLCEVYDAVVLAAGNYEVPYIPDRPGLEEWNQSFPGSVTHVKSYRNPGQFANVTGEIIIVGNSASAGDLAYQLVSELKRPVYKSRRSETLLPAGKSDLITEVADIKCFNPDEKSIELVDGKIISNVGAVVFCTGYIKSFPFFKPNPAYPLLTDGHKVHGTYNHVILYHYPNLAIIGLPKFVLPMRTNETQACWLAKVWAGKVKLPSLEAMSQWESDRTSRMNDRYFHNLIFPEDVQYCNGLIDQIVKSGGKGLMPHEWNKEQTSVRGNMKKIKEAYIEYRAKTGKRASSYEELVEAGVLDTVMLSDDTLKEFGFTF
ncbi:uncharacterized protein J8A68_004755 [[Candida] subhashii]|uniref:Thiol-specific monooxygenase n=1 Tax=[Candida] subhashii TaxID=561895 RepID=A0A8J5UJD9_9ASCO|nr:uncharacterized protein J8A68_004755 [[Candida] subhashii]KAG7661697.1 hypothetical protein J8A68_004755 [[Candida] subhashii]